MTADGLTSDIDLDVDDYEEFGTFGNVKMCGVSSSSCLGFPGSTTCK